MALDIGPLQTGNPDIGPLQSAGAPPGLAIIGDHGIASTFRFGCLGGTVNRGNDQSIYGTCGANGIASTFRFGVDGGVVVSPGIRGTAGIRSTFRFGANGSVVPNPGITGNYGIASTFRFGHGALTIRPWTIFLKNLDVTALARESSLNITDPVGQISTAQIALWDGKRALFADPPDVGQPFLVYRKGQRIFGGSVDEVTQTAYGALTGQIWTIKATDFSQILDRRAVAQYYLGQEWTFETMVQDVVQTYLQQDGISLDFNAITGSFPGNIVTTLGNQLFSWMTARALFNMLSTLTGLDYKVDYYGVLRWFKHGDGTGPAPFNIADSDHNWIAESMSVRKYRTKYRNRQYVVSSTQANSQWQDIFSVAKPGPYPNSLQPPDGLRIAFITLYGISTVPTVTLNGSPQIVLDPGTTPAYAHAHNLPFDWYFLPAQGGFAAGKGVFQNQAHAPITASDVLIVNYQPANITPVVFKDCPAEIAARKAIEGGSGIYDDIQSAPSVTDYGAIGVYAQGLLDRYGCQGGIPVQIIYRTLKDGLLSGMRQHIGPLNSPYVPILPGNADWLISQVQIRDRDATYLEYTVTADSGEDQAGNWEQFFGALITQTQLPQPSVRSIYTWDEAPTTPGVTNPGLNPGNLLAQPVRHQVEVLQYLSVVFRQVPSSPGATFQLLVGSSGVGAQITPAFANQEYRVYFDTTNPGNSLVYAGDLLRILIQGGGSFAGYQDGVVTVVTAVQVA